jgi:SynChlorMet cassette protein ScmD
MTMTWRTSLPARPFPTPRAPRGFLSALEHVSSERRRKETAARDCKHSFAERAVHLTATASQEELDSGEEEYMSAQSKPMAKPHIRLREESDEWVILFDPDTAKARVLNPIGVFIWRLLDGSRSVADIVEQLREHYDNVPEEVEQHVTEFIEVLTKTEFVTDNN